MQVMLRFGPTGCQRNRDATGFPGRQAKHILQLNMQQLLRSSTTGCTPPHRSMISMMQGMQLKLVNCVRNCGVLA